MIRDTPPPSVLDLNSEASEKTAAESPLSTEPQPHVNLRFRQQWLLADHWEEFNRWIPS